MKEVNNTRLEDAIYKAILEHFFDDGKQSSNVPMAITTEACCQVMAKFTGLSPSLPTEDLASKIGDRFSSYREYFLKYYAENPLLRPDRLGYRPL